MSLNQFDLEGAKKIAESLRTLRNLEFVNLSLGHNEIGDEGALEILNALEGRKLKHLSLGLDSVGLSEEGHVEIAKKIRQFESLESLELSLIHNGLENESLEKILKELNGLQVQKLDLVLIGNNITEAEQFGEFLKNQNQLQSLNLNLYANKLGATGGA